LAATVIERADPANGRLLHAAGADTARRLSETLRHAGFEVRTVVLYDAVAVEQLPSEAVAGLGQDTLDGVLLFSPRSAAVFARLTVKAGLADHCGRIAAFCISDATATGLSPLRFARVAIARSPNQQCMLDLIGSAEDGTR
jgi:uroporphyrinogen-III synthase